METRFSSFEQIDTRLEILRTQRQLSLYRLRRQLNDAPGEILRSGWRYGLLPSLKIMAIDWSLGKLRNIRHVLGPWLPQVH
ncbi:MAG: hypothetical protein WBN56_10840 [Robiginitalea sp.]|uniref:hypothetical protein n=1 Tax=Robiginitalea sp. TaxID=1902411 RepID=UPI003C75C33A